MRTIGLSAATVLVISNTIGSGIFMLPSILAKIGSISLIGWIVATCGVLALATILAKLSTSTHGAGVYSYVRKAFGNYLAHQANYIYSVAGIIGNVAMLSIISGYIANIFAIFKIQFYAIFFQIIVIWIIFIINISSTKIVNILQTCAVLFSLVPLVFLITAGLHLFKYSIFIAGWNMSHQSVVAATVNSFHTIMYSFIGIESACVAAILIKKPVIYVPMATIIGTLVTAALYISSCTIIMGVVPYKQLIGSSAPFALALDQTLRRNTIMFIDVCVIVGCFGSLCGWIMSTGQIIKNGAEDGLFPKIFAQSNKHGIPIKGLFIITIITNLITIITISPTANAQFNKVLDISVLLYFLAYLYSCCCIFSTQYIPKDKKSRYIYLIIGFTALIFCVISIITNNLTTIISASIITLSSTVFYLSN